MMLTQQMNLLASDLATQCQVTGMAKEETKKTTSGHFKTTNCSLENCKSEFGDGRRLSDYYFMGCSIGSGGFGSVYAGTCKTTGKGVAIKSISRKKVYCWSMIGNRLVPKEVALHYNLEQKYIIKLLDFFEEQDRFYIVMEKPDKYIDLFDYITKKGKASERSSRYLFRQVLEAVQYCLSMGVVHRDVKDENILIDLNNYQVKLIDFGSGTFLQDDAYTEYEGTTVYCPPEWVLQRCYHAVPATVWSLGILLYNMLMGNVPFEKECEIAAANLYFHIDISDDAESLIRWMLSFDPQDRPTLEQILNHSWLQSSSRSSSSTDYSQSSSSTSPSSKSSSPSLNSSASSCDSSFSTADSCSPGPSYPITKQSPNPIPRYNLRSSTSTATASSPYKRHGPSHQGSSSLTYSPKSFNQHLPSSQSPATSSINNYSSLGALGRESPGNHASRLESDKKSSPRSPCFQYGFSDALHRSGHRDLQPLCPSQPWNRSTTGRREDL